ncbi:hypothetical protein B0H12DRAFT_1072930 [Mycena haematopus]|nr:hypothetical protein B0H12DRAFT_1072930 [Mycena haematopus]
MYKAEPADKRDEKEEERGNGSSTGCGERSLPGATRGNIIAFFIVTFVLSSGLEDWNPWIDFSSWHEKQAGNLVPELKAGIAMEAFVVHMDLGGMNVFARHLRWS